MAKARYVARYSDDSETCAAPWWTAQPLIERDSRGEEEEGRTGLQVTWHYQCAVCCVEEFSGIDHAVAVLWRDVAPAITSLQPLIQARLAPTSSRAPGKRHKRWRCPPMMHPSAAAQPSPRAADLPANRLVMPRSAFQLVHDHEHTVTPIQGRRAIEL
eukprot:2059113-Rhodomonas_salina.3